MSAPEEDWLPLLLAKGEPLLATLFNVSAVRLRERAPAGVGIPYEGQDIPGLVIEVAPAQALGWSRCERCWTWTEAVGQDPDHPSLCDRCAAVVRRLA